MDQIDEICEVARRNPTGTWKSNMTTGSLANQAFATLLHTVTYLAKETDMRSVTDQIGRLTQMIELLDAPLMHIAPECMQLRTRIEEELRRKDFLFVSEEMTKLYNQADPFELGDKLKETKADIQSAAKCLAVGQGTACVFHLMRAMEVAVRKLSRRLGINVTHKTTWRVLTGAMDAKIKKKPDNTEAQKRKKNQWESACTNLHHVGSVWRNNTMHPATSYTPSQAKDVFNAVRVFMVDICKL